MSDSYRAASVVPSPCTGVCRIDGATGWCAGCARSLEEISAWSGFSDAQKRAVWAVLPLRRQEDHDDDHGDNAAAP